MPRRSFDCLSIAAVRFLILAFFRVAIAGDSTSTNCVNLSCLHMRTQHTAKQQHLFQFPQIENSADENGILCK